MGGVFINNSPTNISASCSVMAIVSSNTEILIISENENRKGLIIYNESGYTLYIKFSNGVSAYSFTVQIQPESTYEMNVLYTGNIYGVWDAIDGFAHVTELT